MTALSVNQRASAVGTTTKKTPVELGASLRDEIILILAQGNTGTAPGLLNVPKEVYENTSIGSLFGYGSPVNLSKEDVFTVSAGLKVYILPVGDPAAGGVAALADITTATGAASKDFVIFIESNGNNFEVAIVKDEDQDAIAAKVLATLQTQIRNPFAGEIDAGNTDNIVDLTANFQGTAGNFIDLTVVDSNGQLITAAEYGVDITVTAFTGGAGVIPTATAIAAIPESLKLTRIINQIDDTATLDALKALGDARNVPLLGEIVKSYYGTFVNATSVENLDLAKDAIEVLSDARITDDVNSISPVGGKGLVVQSIAVMVAGVTLRYIGNVGKPPRGVNLELNSSKPRTALWFTATQRDEMYKKGITNYELISGQMKLFDLCSMYHPASDNILSSNPPINFNDEDATAIGNMQYSIIQTFKNVQWEAVKFIGDDEVSSNDAARKLAAVETQLDTLIGDWLDPYLFIKNVQESIETKTVNFDGTNSERVNMVIPVTMASTGRIYDIVTSATKSN